MLYFVQYFILISILCGAELVCGVLGYLYSETLSVLLQQELLTGIQAHYNTSKQYRPTGITLAWDHIQYQVNYIIMTIIVTYTLAILHFL